MRLISPGGRNVLCVSLSPSLSLHVDHVSWAGLELNDCLAPVKYEAGSNRESIQWMFTVRQEGGRRGESENRGGSISSCCLPPALLTPKNAARKPNFPFLRLRSCWRGSRCSVRRQQGQAAAVLGPRQPLNYIILVRPRGWRSPVETLNVVTRDLGSSPTSHLAATGWELRVSWAGAVGERNQGLCWAELYRDSAPCHCHCHCIQSHDVTW